VRHLMHPPVKLAAWPDGDPRTSRIVFITRDLPRAIVEDGLRAFQAATNKGEGGEQGFAPPATTRPSSGSKGPPAPLRVTGRARA
jgi:hypothetical protein